jgi:hypothetical protein
MKRKTTLKTKNYLHTSLRQKLVIGVAGMILVIVAGGMIYFNFFTSTESRANYYEDGTEVQSLLLTSMCSENPAVNRRWRVRNPNLFDVPVQWDVYPDFQTGLLVAHPGDNFFYTNTIPGPNTVRIRWQDQNEVWQQTVKASGGQACSAAGCYASEVISYTPTKRNDGSLVPAERRVTSKALGAPEGDDALNFVSLGFGGEIVLKFASPIANGEGNDIKITETTYGSPTCNRYPEKVQAFASQDGCNFIYLGERCQDAQFDLGEMTWAQYIKLRDVSPIDHPYNDGVADGYDVDAVECLHGAALSTPNDGLVAGSAQEVIHYEQGTRKNGTAIHPTRTNADNALGIPQNNDIGINFVSLGFSGSIIVKFDFVIFNKPGNDVRVVETSFGQQNCNSYHEQAYFEGSLDGSTWKPMGELCLDGELDLGDDTYAIQYMRVTDRSPATLFTNSADGYDLDGILVLNSECTTDARISSFDNNTIPDEIAEVQIGPNPFRDEFNLNYESGSVDEKVNIRLFNYVGQMVHQESVSIPKNTKYSHEINAGKFPKGVYIVTLESGGQKQSLKVIKN